MDFKILAWACVAIWSVVSTQVGALAQDLASNQTTRRKEEAEWPVSFEANVGQANSEVKFVAHGSHANLLLTHGEAWLRVLDHSGTNESSLTLRLGLAGANSLTEPAGVHPMSGRVNYFMGNDSRRWLTNVPAFAQVEYKEVYPGVDLVYHGNQQRLEYDFIIQPGAEPNRIALEFGGARELSVEEDGQLRLQAGNGAIRLRPPVAYQQTGATRSRIACRYLIHSANQVGFRLGDYDHARSLVIDPVIAYTQLFGGSGGPSQGLAIALGTNDNVYLAGNTMSANFPLAGAYQSNFTGAQDAFVAGFDTNGVMLFSTFLGGNGVQSGQGIALDSSGNIFVTGYTSSTNFPTQNALQATNAGGYDAFVTELSPDGKELVFSTYLGGSGFDAANAIALDTNASPIITGYTQSTNWPTVQAAQPIYGGNGDAFVAKLNPSGPSLDYSTYLGGNDSENNGPSSDIDPVANLGDLAAHLGGALAVDLNANAYITGWTYSTNFPVLNAYQPTNLVSSPGSDTTPIVAKFDPSGNLIYSTYFGGASSDSSRAIGVDFSGNVYFAGSWWGTDLPATNAFRSAFSGSYGLNGLKGASGDAFIAAVDGTGTNLVWATYFGGSGDEQINGMAVRPDGAIAITGWTDSPNFPLANATQGNTEQGFFSSTTGGGNWSASDAGLSPSPIAAIGVDPFNSSNLYAVEGNGGGLFQSTNGGVHWTLDTFNVSSSAIVGSSQQLIAFDPRHQGIAYAGGFTGVFKTTNSGAAWISASSGLPGTAEIQALAVDPNAPATLFASAYNNGLNGLYQSTNGGNSWNALMTGLPGYAIVTALLVDPLNSSNVYAGAENNFFASPLYKSADDGNSWNPLQTLPAFGLGVMAIAASPGNPADIYVLLGGGGSSAALCLTTNGGLTWSSLLEATNQNLTTLAVASPLEPTLAIGLVGTNASISWPTTFAGYALQFSSRLVPDAWTNATQGAQIIDGNNVATIPLTGAEEFYRLADTNPAPQPPALYIGTDLEGGQGVLRSADGGATWEEAGLAGQTINALAVGSANPNLLQAGLAGSYDAFVATFSPPLPNRLLYFSTYLGGSGADRGNAIAAGFSTLSVFVTGASLSPGFPTTLEQSLPPHPRDVAPPAKGLTAKEESFLGHYLAAMTCPPPTNGPIIVDLEAGANYPNKVLVLIPRGATVLSTQGTAPAGVNFSIESDADKGKGEVLSDYLLEGSTTDKGTFQYSVTFTSPTLGCTFTYIFIIHVT